MTSSIKIESEDLQAHDKGLRVVWRIWCGLSHTDTAKVNRLLTASTPCLRGREQVRHLSFWRDSPVFNIPGSPRSYLWAQDLHASHTPRLQGGDLCLPRHLHPLATLGVWIAWMWALSASVAKITSSPAGQLFAGFAGQWLGGGNRKEGGGRNSFVNRVFLTSIRWVTGNGPAETSVRTDVVSQWPQKHCCGFLAQDHMHLSSGLRSTSGNWIFEEISVSSVWVQELHLQPLVRCKLLCLTSLFFLCFLRWSLVPYSMS